MEANEKITGEALIKKILRACKAVGQIEKTGLTDEGVPFHKQADIYKAFREELFNRGILLLQDEQSLDVSHFKSNGGGMLQECRLKIAFTLTDGQESLTIHGHGLARHTSDKAVYMAKSGATKHFFKALGLVHDETDMPDGKPSVFDGEPWEYQSPQPNNAKGGEKISVNEHNAIMSAAKKSGKTSELISEYCAKVGVPEIAALPKSKYKPALEWAMGKAA